MRRGLIISQSPPACWVKASHTTQGTVNQEDTQDHPQKSQANHGTATPPTLKAQTHTEANPHQPKARQTMGEYQKLICHTLDWWKPIPTHTNTLSTGSATTPISMTQLLGKSTSLQRPIYTCSHLLTQPMAVSMTKTITNRL